MNDESYIKQNNLDYDCKLQESLLIIERQFKNKVIQLYNDNSLKITSRRYKNKELYPLVVSKLEKCVGKI